MIKEVPLETLSGEADGLGKSCVQEVEHCNSENVYKDALTNHGFSSFSEESEFYNFTFMYVYKVTQDATMYHYSVIQTTHPVTCIYDYGSASQK